MEVREPKTMQTQDDNQPKNISEMQLLARGLYGSGKKNQAIGAICDCIKLLSAGTLRQFKDMEEVNGVMIEFNTRLKALENLVKELSK
jgi:hypothetical protein